LDFWSFVERAQTGKAKSNGAPQARTTAQLPAMPDTQELGTLETKKVPGLGKELRVALKTRGIKSLFEVQHRSFGPVLDGKDVIGKARTGCGKTLAFLLPLVQRLEPGKSGEPLVLIVGRASTLGGNDR